MTTAPLDLKQTPADNAAISGAQASKAWQNWSGNQSASPDHILRPGSVKDLANAVADAKGPVRVAGAGHSFTPLVTTGGTLIDLSALAGPMIGDVDASTGRVWLKAGARLSDLSRALDAMGFAFRNLGDIDVQTLAGAVSTGTHGTGLALGCLSSEITGVKLVTANGEQRCITQETDSDLVHAAQVSLGTFGVITELQMALVPSYRLHRRSRVARLADMLEQAPDIWAEARNFEFFYISFSGRCIAVHHDVTEADLTDTPQSDDDAAVMGLKKLRDALWRSKTLRHAALSSAFDKVPDESRTDAGWKLLANARNVRFNEMEYHLPPETALETLAELVTLIERRLPKVFFPIEVRRTAGDDGWLSPFNGGGRISIAVHAYHEDSFDWFFSHAEPLLREAGGRPHWGKLHSLKAADMAKLYPAFERFNQFRKKLDPYGKFMTPYLHELLG